MARRRKQFGSPEYVHTGREKAAIEAIKRRERDTIATANAGQCRTAIYKLTQMAYWVGTLEAENRGARHDQLVGGPAFDDAVERYTRTRDRVLARCAPAARRRR